MDTGRQNRKYPGLTTEELKIGVVDYQMGLNPNAKYMTEEQIAAKIADMTEEVRKREAGLSKPFIVPQIEKASMRPVTRIGRM